MKTLTFVHTCKYAGGRSHRNIENTEFVDRKNIFSVAEMYGLHVYPVGDCEDFTDGVNDWNGNEIMDSEDFEKWEKTGVGSFDFGDTRIYSCLLEDIDAKEFKAIPNELKLEYVNLYYPDVDMDLLDIAIQHDGAVAVFEYSDINWDWAKEQKQEEE